VNQAIRLQGVETMTTKFLQENALPHIAKITQQKIEELGWKFLNHSQYSPDSAPFDYNLVSSVWQKKISRPV